MVDITDQFANECLAVFHRTNGSPIQHIRAVLEFAFWHRDLVAEVTDAAVEALAAELRGIWFPRGGTWEHLGDGGRNDWCRVARHVLTGRQPKPEDVERLGAVAEEAWRKWAYRTGDQKTGWQAVARAILALCDVPPHQPPPTPDQIADLIWPLTGMAGRREAFDGSLRNQVDDIARIVAGVCGGPTHAPTFDQIDRMLEPEPVDWVEIAHGRLWRCAGQRRRFNDTNTRIATLGAAERTLSDAYVRLRSKIPGAMDTPHAPSPETVWSVTEAALDRLLDELAAAKSAPAIRLGEGLTEAQEGWSARKKISQAEIFDGLRERMGGFFWDDTAQGFDYWRDVSVNAERMATALRASAAPTPEPVDWVARAAEYLRRDGHVAAKEIITGLVARVEVLQARGV